MPRTARNTIAVVVLALLASAAYFVLHLHFRAQRTPVVVRVPATPVDAPPQGTLVDPLATERLVTLDAGMSGPSPQRPSLAAGDETARLGRPSPHSAWVTARPGFQYSRSPEERGGIEPCASQPVERSGFEDWRALSRGKFVAPRGLHLDEAGNFPLIVHLHGEEAVLREVIESRQPFVLYSLTLDASESYAPDFMSPALETSIRTEIEQALSERLGKPARVGKLVMSAWSAGFAGIQAALARKQPVAADAVLLIDGLHAPRDADVMALQLKPFAEYAARAAEGHGFLFVSHSSVDPPDFASTTEAAHHLIAALGGKPQPVRRSDRWGMELVEYFTRGEFHVRGYAGNAKPDHCAQLALLRDVLALLGARWKQQELPAPAQATVHAAAAR